MFNITKLGVLFSVSPNMNLEMTLKNWSIIMSNNLVLFVLQFQRWYAGGDGHILVLSHRPASGGPSWPYQTRSGQDCQGESTQCKRIKYICKAALWESAKVLQVKRKQVWYFYPGVSHTPVNLLVHQDLCGFVQIYFGLFYRNFPQGRLVN